MNEEDWLNPSRFASLPNYHMHTYDYSNKAAFKFKFDQIDESKAKEALRILIGFIKEEIEHSPSSKSTLTYEPLLTHLLKYEEKYLL